METMELFVLNKEFVAIGIVDSYESLLWVDRYNDVGDFEIYTPYNIDLINLLKKGYYLTYLYSEHAMIIETVRIVTNHETGNFVYISGRSLESILSRRIVWGQININGSIEFCVKQLLEKNIISPEIPERKIDNFIYEESTDLRLSSLTYDAQYTGDNLLDVIVEMCNTVGIGFKIVLSEDNKFIFSLYKGVDRSYNQSDYPYVIFSREFDNILESEYIDDDTMFCNVTLVGGEGEGSARKTLVVGEASGLERKEHFTDARDISTYTDGADLTPAQYNEKLKQRGEEELSELKQTKTFEGQVDYNTNFILNEDYFIGDTVQIENDYGIQGTATVLEIIRSNDKEGFKVSPTFSDVVFDDEGV